MLQQKCVCFGGWVQRDIYYTVPVFQYSSHSAMPRTHGSLWLVSSFFLSSVLHQNAPIQSFSLSKTLPQQVLLIKYDTNLKMLTIRFLFIGDGIISFCEVNKHSIKKVSHSQINLSDSFNMLSLRWKIKGYNKKLQKNN